MLVVRVKLCVLQSWHGVFDNCVCVCDVSVDLGTCNLREPGNIVRVDKFSVCVNST